MEKRKVSANKKTNHSVLSFFEWKSISALSKPLLQTQTKNIGGTY
jgi:hypothetical protein